MRLSLAAAVAGLCAIYVAPQAHSEPSVIPPVSAAAAAVGFVDVRAAVPDAVIDLRYATAGNFAGTQLYPAGARCLVHQSIAPGLAAAAEVLRAGGERLVFWDCYRPHSVQVRMFDAVPDPNWVAEPGAYSKSHESGRSVDVTLYGPGGLVDMGTGFDDFTAADHRRPGELTQPTGGGPPGLLRAIRPSWPSTSAGFIGAGPQPGRQSSIFCHGWHWLVLNDVSVAAIWTICGFLLIALSTTVSPATRFQ